MEKTKKKYGFDRIFVLTAAILSLVSVVLFIFTNIMLPLPLAELVSVTYYFLNSSTPTAETVISSVIFLLVYLFSIGAMVWVFASKKKCPIWIKLPLSLVLLTDLAVHGYAFLFSSGYNWNYLIAAILDIFVVALVFYENKGLLYGTKGE